MVEINSLKITDVKDGLGLINLGGRRFIIDRRDPRPFAEAAQLRQNGVASREIIGALERIGVLINIS